MAPRAANSRQQHLEGSRRGISGKKKRSGMRNAGEWEWERRGGGGGEGGRGEWSGGVGGGGGGLDMEDRVLVVLIVRATIADQAKSTQGYEARYICTTLLGCVCTTKPCLFRRGMGGQGRNALECQTAMCLVMAAY